MPELPEVQTVVTTLRPLLMGRRFTAVRLLRPDILGTPNVDLPAELMGQTVQSIHRRGKRILICVGNDRTLAVHLGMTGRLTVCPADSPLVLHTHLLIDLDNAVQLRFIDPRRFGGVWLLNAADCADDRLGPEPFDLTPAQLARRLSATRRPIKTALLDQQLIAGLGNIYVDESLFGAGIYPLIPASALSPEQITRLNRSIKLILRRAIRAGGSSLRDYVDANGNPGQFQDLHRVYAREGEPCRRCRTPIQRIVLGGRSTHFCSHCQPQ